MTALSEKFLNDASTHISVILPSYNYARYLPEAIDSVLGQDYPLWELLIIDDGSADDSAEIARDYARRDSRIRFLQHPDKANHGLAATLLLGLNESRYDIVAFLESDDAWEVGSLTGRLELMQVAGTALVFNAPKLVIEEGRNPEYYLALVSILESIIAKRQPSEVQAHELMAVNLIPSFSCCMVNRKMLLDCDFSSPVAPLLDKWLWQQLSLMGHCRFLPLPLTRWRLHTQSYISTSYIENSSEESQLWQVMVKGLLSRHLAENPHRRGDLALRIALYLPALHSLVVRFWLKLRSQGVAGVWRAISKRLSRLAGTSNSAGKKIPEENGIMSAPIEIFPIFSICIPAYNNLAAFSRCFESVVQQSEASFECLISDDSINDNIKCYIESYIHRTKDSRIKYVHNRPSLGAPANWNAVLGRAQGSIITLLHQDDWYPSVHSLAQVREGMESSAADLLISGRALYEGGVCLGEYTNIALAQKNFIRNFPAQTLVINRLGHPSVFFFLNTLKRISYNEKLCYFSDTEYYQRLILAAQKIATIDQALVALERGGEGQLSGLCFARPEELLDELLYVLNVYKARTVPKSLAVGRFLVSTQRHWRKNHMEKMLCRVRERLSWPELAIVCASAPVFCGHMLYRLIYRRITHKPWG